MPVKSRGKAIGIMWSYTGFYIVGFIYPNRAWVVGIGTPEVNPPVMEAGRYGLVPRRIRKQRRRLDVAASSSIMGRGWMDRILTEIKAGFLSALKLRTGYQYVLWEDASDVTLKGNTHYLLNNIPGLPGYAVIVATGPERGKATYVSHWVRKADEHGNLQELEAVPGIDYGDSTPGYFWAINDCFELEYILGQVRHRAEQARGFHARITDRVTEHPWLREYEWLTEGLAKLEAADDADIKGIVRAMFDATDELPWGTMPDDRDDVLWDLHILLMYG